MTHEAGLGDRRGDLLAAYGADFGRWPDAASAGEARRALLADRSFRRDWDAAAQLDAALAAERDLQAGRITTSGALDRLTRRTIAAVRPRPFAGLGWHRLAAALALAVVLGGSIDMLFGSAPVPETSPVVVVDSLLFGPESVEL